MRRRAPHKKSTNVRLSVIRAGFRLLGAVSPRLAATTAMSLFRRPPRHRHSAEERTALAAGQRNDQQLDGSRLAVWQWGHGPAVLLVHGWGSRGARLASFVAPLTAAGYSVVAFDAPGHGASAGRLSSLPQFIEAIEALGARFGPLAAVVAHSMGGPATTLAMARGLAVERLVFLAPAADPAGFSDRFAKIVRLTPDVHARMRRLLELRFGMAWADFDVPAAAKKQTAPLLIFHDAEDHDVPPTDGEAIAAAWPGARLVITEGLGHRRIVHDPSVVSRAVAFLSEGESATRLSGRA
jgi:pimeloyl-ACP methyl ester carboxylesterase